jgi:hypothetical protein
MRLFALVSLFVAFTSYTLFVMAGHGYDGFLTLAGREPWALQLLLDLLLMLGLFSAWLVPDAKEHGLPAWPYVILSMTMGSMGALIYLLHREIVRRRRSKETMA